MRRIRDSLLGIASATLIVHVLIVTLGALRVCWAEHTHGGVAAPDCPMHYRTDQTPLESARHGHHHGSDDGAAGDDNGRITCDCSGDPTAIYLGLVAIAIVPVSFPPSTQAVRLAPEVDSSLIDHWEPSISPPPRSTFSQLS